MNRRPPSRGVVAVALIASVLAAACAGGGDAPTGTTGGTTTTQTTAEAPAAHVAADPCAPTEGIHSNLPQRCDRGAARESIERPIAKPSAPTVSADCAQPARVIAYAQDDWIGLAQDMAAAPEGCIEAWISVPTEEGADHAWLTTRARMQQRFAAIGDNVHPLPEVNFNDWNAWGKDHPEVSWLERGRRARAEMEKAGYDFDKGDRWALNEIPVAALASGADRDAVRDLITGLQAGSAEPTGVVYVVMNEQRQGMTPALEQTLRGWFADEPFWRELRKAVDVYSVEAYASIRDTCEPGLPAKRQIAGLRAYADHRVRVAERLTLPDEGAVRAVLGRSVPLVNAAWSWPDAYGYTAVAAGPMERFVGLQVAASGRVLDGQLTIGFAWAPKRPDGMPPATYRRQLGRIGGALRDAIVNENRSGGRTPVGPCSYPGARLANWG